MRVMKYLSRVTLKVLFLLSFIVSPAVLFAAKNSCLIYFKGEGSRLIETNTLDGQSPADFFRDHKDMNTGRPRYVLMIGVPGGGKSTWATAARKNGWTVVENDGLRVDLLTEMKEAGLKVPVLRDIKSGEIRDFEAATAEEKESAETVWETPNPIDPSHLFSKVPFPHPFQDNAPNYKGQDISLFSYAFIEASRIQQLALEGGTPYVSDQVNGHAGRVKEIHMARSKGRYVEGLYFQSDNVQINKNNIALRASKGGFFLAGAIVDSLYKGMDFTNENLIVDPSYLNVATAELANPNMGVIFSLPGRFPSLKSAAEELKDSDEGSFLNIYVGEHILNRLSIVKVKDYTKEE